MGMNVRPVISWYTSQPLASCRYVATVMSGLTSVVFVTIPCGQDRGSQGMRLRHCSCPLWSSHGLRPQILPLANFLTLVGVCASRSLVSMSGSIFKLLRSGQAIADPGGLQAAYNMQCDNSIAGRTCSVTRWPMLVALMSRIFRGFMLLRGLMNTSYRRSNDVGSF